MITTISTAVDSGACVVGLAFSDDRIHWQVRERPFLTPESMGTLDVTRVYDPRLTVINGACYFCCAVDTHHGIRGCIARTEDFEKESTFFPERSRKPQHGVVSERSTAAICVWSAPMPVYSLDRDRFDIWLSASPDLRYWGDSRMVQQYVN